VGRKVSTIMTAQATHIAAVRRRRFGRAAATPFALAAAAAAAENRLVAEPLALGSLDWLAVSAASCALVCLLMPWERIGAGWFYPIPAVATTQAALLVSLVERHQLAYGLLFVSIAVLVANSFTDRRVLAVALGLPAFGAGAPLLYGPDAGGAERMALLGVLAVLFSGVVVALVRERLQAERQALDELVARDPLTGLANGRLFDERLRYEIVRHRRRRRTLAVVLVDLDGFGDVNERLGRQVGDLLLCEVAKALTRTVRAEDTVARLGADEFALLAPESGVSDVVTLAYRIERALERTRIESRPLRASIGWALHPDGGTTPEALIASAREDRHLAQRSGRTLDPPGEEIRAAALRGAPVAAEEPGALFARPLPRARQRAGSGRGKRD